jgi:hypothetical protein
MSVPLGSTLSGDIAFFTASTHSADVSSITATPSPKSVLRFEHFEPFDVVDQLQLAISA